MINSVKNYIYNHRRGLAKTVGVVGGTYLIGRYAIERLEEVKEKVMQERLARDGLRRRFIQNQENVSFTIMALIPTLGEQILDELDVEAVIHELQTKSRSFRTPSEPPPPSESSIASSVELLREQDARSDIESVSASSISGHEDSGMSLDHGESSHSWVDQLSVPPSQPSTSRQPSVTRPETDSVDFLTGAQLSDSITTASSALSYGNGTGLSPPQRQSPESSLGSAKSKGELWREVKMLTVTRTLTIIYSTTLLSLFTNIQLTLLARSKYVHSVLQQERDERLREQLEFSASVSSMFWGGVGNLLDLENLALDDEVEEEISEQIEIKYLTLSWWILHVGWKDIAERVRKGVEEVFEGVSLKTKLGAIELHRLVSDVRRRVEYEVTFEGNERRINFLSSLLPPTTETMQHVLTQGGVSPYLAAHHDAVFTSLLDETRNLITSSDFERVLELGLDRATEVLFDGVQKNVFVDPNSPLDGSQDLVRLRLAGLLPGLARWSHLALNGLPNELVDSLTGLREVAGFSAIIFSTFEDRYR